MAATEAAAPARTLPAVRRTLLVSITVLFVLATVVLFFAARSYGLRAADRSYDHLLRASALSMADSVAVVEGRWQVDLPYAALDLLAAAPEDRAYYRITGPQGDTITGYGDLPAPPGSAGASAQPLFFDARYRGEPVRFAVVPRAIAGGDGSGRFWVQVGQTRQARDALAADIVWRATAAIGALMLGVFLLLWLGVDRALRPLARLQQELMQRDASDLRPIASPVPRELAQVVRALDGFMGRLSFNLDALRIFIAEAAHQMRTPLAALIAQAQEGLDDDDPRAQRQSLQAVERNALRLRRLLNQLLSDASVTHQGHLQRFSPVDVLALVHEALRDVVPRAEPQPVVRLWWQTDLLSKGELLALYPKALDAKNTRNSSHAAAQAWVRGDALMLREAFKNLVDNALKHGGGSAVEVTVRAAADPTMHAWQVEVADHGPGVQAADQGRLFERFARGPGAAAGGAGLGLAIVQRVVASHGGQIAAANRAEGGWCITLTLPAAPQPARPHTRENAS
ncbi:MULTISPECIES: sensor histidine kinase [unclassified Acidovorax]|uniref:sensor histidine kinase n=1 Tax=unclassified Acidovorax TaxID=2684926 RepID=UPI002883387B|nr:MULTISPECIES: sensor histidine kinase [unclassified Acidovorax]